jgi:hypothetical protein
VGKGTQFFSNFTWSSTLTLEDIKDVKFPMSSYDFKLACQACFKKTGDGIHGSQNVLGVLTWVAGY